MILDPKMTHLPHLDHNISFILKSKAATFTESHQVQFQKNLMSRFRENLKVLILGPNFTHFSHFLHTKKIPLKFVAATF